MPPLFGADAGGGGAGLQADGPQGPVPTVAPADLLGMATGLDQSHGVQFVREAVDVPLGVPEPPGHQDDREVERHAVRQGAVPTLVNDIERESVEGVVQAYCAHLQGQAVTQGRRRLTGQPRTGSGSRGGGQHPDCRRRRFDGPRSRDVVAFPVEVAIGVLVVVDVVSVADVDLQVLQDFGVRDNAAHLVKVNGVASTPRHGHAGRLDDVLEGHQRLTRSNNQKRPPPEITAVMMPPIGAVASLPFRVR